MLTLFRALRYRAFALLWGGQTISTLGDKVFQVALAWWVLEETGSPVAMATVLFLTTAPMLVFLLVGGVLVDRFPRLQLLLISDLLRGVVIGLAAWFALMDWLTIWHVYAFSLVFGSVAAFFHPAFRAAIPDVIPPEGLTSANSLTSLSAELSGIVGPAVGAGIVALSGTPLAFAVDSISFLVSAGCLALAQRAHDMRAVTSEVRTEAKPLVAGVWADLRQGLGAVKASAWLWVTIAVAGLANIAYAGPMEVALPFLISESWHADVNVLGLFYSASSAGSLLAAGWLGRLPALRRRGMMLYAAWMLIGLLVLAVGLPIGIPGILIAALLIGLCNTIVGLVWTNSLQELVPQRLLGRVTSMDYLGSLLLLPIGFAWGAWGTSIAGPSSVFIIGGALMAGLVALGLLHPEVRALD